MVARTSNIEQLFDAQLGRGWHGAASLAVYVRGHLVLDLQGSNVNASAVPEEGRRQLFVGFSCGKPLAAACLWVLHEQGRFNWDDPVASYWPEFAARGKANTTIRHVLTHRAGLPTTPAPVNGIRMGDFALAARLVAEAEPEYAPGSAIQYHSVTFGWLVGELVQRIAGRPFRDFFEAAVKRPLELRDTYFGRPPGLAGRVARLSEAADTDQPRAAELFNLARIQESVIPAANVITTARDLARFYASLVGGGRLNGARWLGRAGVAEATSPHAEGPERGDGELRRWGLGIALGGSHPAASTLGPNSSSRAFAHGGYGTSIAWGDPGSGIAMAYLTSGIQGAELNLERLSSMSRTVRETFEA